MENTLDEKFEELKKYISGFCVGENIQDISELKTVEEKYNYNCKIFDMYANNNAIIYTIREYLNELEELNEKQLSQNIVNSYDMNDEELTGFID